MPRPRGYSSWGAWLACRSTKTKQNFLTALDDDQLQALPYCFDIWALSHQIPPAGEWRAWVILGGRGAGKTRAGSEWVRQQVEGARPFAPGRARRVALLGETYDQVRDVMIEGDSGLLACAPPDRRPIWKASARKLIWPNGAEAQAFSAQDPEALRGPQFDAAWADELAKWKKGQEAWDMLQFALRLGDTPRVCVTTTPRVSPLLKDLLASPTTVQTHAPTMANRANLAPSFLAEVKARYGGTRLGQQELMGQMLSEVDGAMWSTAQLSDFYCTDPPQLDRVVVAVDPAVTAKGTSDACGILVVGANTSGPVEDWRAYVLADYTTQAAGPLEWATAAVAAHARHNADRLVAEVNQGGALIETLLRQVDPHVPFRARYAAKGKSARAEPVAALYEQGKVRHLPGLTALEEQMCQMTPQGYQGTGSPDRLDALVWALTELMIDPSKPAKIPRARQL
ncbi:DNA-packaging protein [Epibacterium ulvae]|uniref:DNA-packaging protein n=1 Tax=Epibacterium ulvae TaxID=1156985 RepID=UPI0024924813|nr:terminase family protein [Epibacterium ulvae]